MWDRGLHSFEMVQKTHAKGAQFLSRVPRHVQLKPLHPRSDGSYLAYIYPSDYQRRKRGEHLLVGVMIYTLTDPALPGYGQTHRLLTSRLDASRYPALELACAYHERWECENTVAEIDTHQRLVRHPLRSQKPVGVMQELYGLLIAHYAVRRIIYQAAVGAGVDPDRISFTKAISLFCDAIGEFQMVAPEQREGLYRRLLPDIARHCLPERVHRSNPRVVKRNEHRQRPQPSIPFWAAVNILN
jgi:Transposase DDE domain